MTALKFFSKLADAISSAQPSMTAKQARKLISKSGAPPREIEHTRILDTINNHQAQFPGENITQQQLLDAINQRPLKLKTTRRTSTGDATSFHMDDEPEWMGSPNSYDPETRSFHMDTQTLGGTIGYDDEFESHHVLINSYLDLTNVSDNDLKPVYDELISITGDPSPENLSLKDKVGHQLTKTQYEPNDLPAFLRPYEKYEIHGPTGYVDHARSWDEAVTRSRDHLEDNVPESTSAKATRYADPEYRSRGPLPSDSEYGEVTIELDRPTVTAASDPENISYTSGHWSEPDVVSHYRYSTNRPLLSDPTSSKRHFHQEEFQSDWGEQARDQGILGQPRYRREDVEFRPVFFQEEGEIPGHSTRFGKWRDATPDETPTAYMVDYIENPNTDHATRQMTRVPATTEDEAWEYFTTQSPHGQGATPPGPYTSTNAWEQLTLRTALADAIESGHDIFTWPMGREHYRRYPGSEKILSGNMASSDQRAVNYFNKLLKPYGQRVTHDRLVTEPEIQAYTLDTKLTPIEALQARPEPDLFGATIRDDTGRVLDFIDETELDSRPWVYDSAIEAAQEQARTIRDKAVRSLDRVHSIQITPEMREMFKKGIPLSVAPLMTLSLIGEEIGDIAFEF